MILPKSLFATSKRVEVVIRISPRNFAFAVQHETSRPGVWNEDPPSNHAIFTVGFVWGIRAIATTNIHGLLWHESIGSPDWFPFADYRKKHTGGPQIGKYENTNRYLALVCGDIIPIHPPAIMSASDSFRTARSPDPFYSPQSSQGYRIVTPSIRQTSNISTRSPQVHTVQGIETAPAPTMQRNISRSPAFDYDAEAAQGYAALYGSVHLLKKPPSLGDDMEIFESYREKDQMGFKAPMRRGTSDRLTSTDYSTVTRGASTFSRRDETQKAMVSAQFRSLSVSKTWSLF